MISSELLTTLILLGIEFTESSSSTAAIWQTADRILKCTHPILDRKSTRLNSSHSQISYAVFCLKKKKSRIPYHISFFASRATRSLYCNLYMTLRTSHISSPAWPLRSWIALRIDIPGCGVHGDRP